MFAGEFIVLQIQEKIDQGGGRFIHLRGDQKGDREEFPR